MRKFGPHLVVLLLALGLLWGLGIFSKVTAPPPASSPAIAVDSSILVSSNPSGQLSKTTHGQKSSTVSTEKLYASGLTLKKWIEQIADAAALPVKWATPNDEAWIQSIQITSYVGDVELSLADTMDIAAVLEVNVAYNDAKDTLLARRFSNEEILWKKLNASFDPTGSKCGALRPWRHLHWTRNQEKPIQKAGRESSSLEQLESAIWTLGSLNRAVYIESDGSLERMLNHSVLDTEELKTFEGLCTEATQQSTPLIRVKIAQAIAEIFLRLYPPLAAHHPVWKWLEIFLNDPDADVACSTAQALSNSLSNAALELLVKKLESSTSKENPLLLAALLTSIVQIDATSRQNNYFSSDETSLSVRRNLFEKVRAWMPTYSVPQKWTEHETLCAAAWLKLSHALFPEPTVSEQAAKIQALLAQSTGIEARYVAAEFESAKAPGVLPPCVLDLQLASVAGPRWMRYTFSLAQAQGLLASANRRDVQAALWRLNQPTSLQNEQHSDPEILLGLIGQLRLIASQATSSILREKALTALYRERTGVTTGAEHKTWCFENDPTTAFEVFEKDSSNDVQTTAAQIMARTLNISELERLLHLDLSGRAPLALERLLEKLQERISKNHVLNEDFAPLFYTLVDTLLKSKHEGVAHKAAWARVHDSTWDLTRKINFIKSLKTSHLRIHAILGLQQRISKHEELTPKMIRILLADEEESVQTYVLHAVQFTMRNGSPELIHLLKELVESTPHEKIRSAAQELLAIAEKKTKLKP